MNDKMLGQKPVLYHSVVDPLLRTFSECPFFVRFLPVIRIKSIIFPVIRPLFARIIYGIGFSHCLFFSSCSFTSLSVVRPFFDL